MKALKSERAKQIFADPNARTLLEALKGVQESQDWMLISPDGRVWRGDPQKMIAVLAPHHPLLAPVLKISP